MKSLYIDEIRSGIIEATHKIHAVALRGDMKILSIGNENLAFPLRSSAKPFMLCPLLDACIQNGIALTDSQIVIMASSHNGEAVHRDCVQSVLDLSGFLVDDLGCGTHMPFFDWLYDDFFAEKNMAKRQLYHNCSGKHAGMLLLAKLRGYSGAKYWGEDHPAQRDIIASLKTVLDITESDVFSIGMDGCGVPTYCITLQKLAHAYQLLYRKALLSPVAAAILAEPYMIAGKDRIETDIISQCGFIAKSGSSGIFCVSIPAQDLSIALKVESGNDDAAESAIVELLDKLGLLEESCRDRFEKYRILKIYTSNQQVAGMLRPRWI